MLNYRFTFMKRLFLLLFFLAGISGFSQAELKGKILDAPSGKTIPYANIYLKNQPVGTTAFRDGSFSLKLDSVFHDSVIFSIIGYRPTSLYLPEVINGKSLEIILEPSQEELKEVQVIPRKLKSYEAGLLRRRAGHELGTHPERPDARFVPNEYQVDAYIKNVAVYVSKKGIPEAPFRVNLLQADKVSGKPGAPLIEEDFILNATEKGNEWVGLDLESKLIRLPKQGFFVVVQSLPIDSVQVLAYQNRLPGMEEWRVKLSAPLFGHAFEAYSEAAKANWCFHCWGENEWTPEWRKVSEKLDSVRPGITAGRASSLMIKAEISYYADQKLKVKEIRAKRGTRKVFDRPTEDNLKYPQSSPQYLLSSLSKAFEADNLAYVCNYLVYYEDKNELDETMAFLESQADDAGKVSLSEEEKEDVIDLLNSMSTQLQNLKPSEEDRFVFELEFDKSRYYFQSKNGAWKINPRSTSLLKPNMELKIPTRF